MKSNQTTWIEDWARAAFDAHPDLMVVTDANGQIRQANHAWLRVLGIDAAALLGQKWSAFISSRMLHLTAPSTLESPRGGHLVAFANRTNEPKWLNWTRTALPDGQGALWTGRELAAQETGSAFLPSPKSIARNQQTPMPLMSDPIAQVAGQMRGFLFELLTSQDKIFHFSWASENAWQIFESDNERVLQCDLSNLFFKRDFPGLLIELLDSMDSLRPFSWRGRVQTESGMNKWVQVFASPTRETDGAIKWHGLLLDIHAQREAEADLELERAKAIGAAKMATLGEMTAGIAHEINNPLAVILGKAEQLSELAQTPNPNLDLVSDHTEKIIKMTQRISKIIHGLRSFARNAEADPYELKPLAQIVEDTAELCAARFRSNNVQLQVSPLPPGLSIECRYVQISQVLLNLLNNAFDAIQDFKKKWIRLDFEVEGSVLRMRVTDCGLGISDEVAPHITVPFFTTKPPGKGTGLGLSLAVEMMEAHGGTLRLDRTQPNTSFVLELPLRQPRENVTASHLQDALDFETESAKTAA